LQDETDKYRIAEEFISKNADSPIHNFSKEILLSASSLREKYSISFWDSIIIASALNSGCSTLATEDMHDGLKIGNMVVKNIFRQTFH